jgi:hypothetical protein
MFKCTSVPSKSNKTASTFSKSGSEAMHAPH